jgi:5-methylcytosine-specific restriction endonuclease McrA
VSRLNQVFTDLDGLLEQVALQPVAASTGGRGGQYVEFALRHAERLLRSDYDQRARRNLEVRLRLAIHLSPASAIAYDSASPVPRWKLICDHISRVFERSATQSEALARAVATVLDNWDRTREQVTTYSIYLMRRDGPFCSNCRFHFGSWTAAPRRDEFKPYFLSPEELTAPEVDHIETVSTLGSNFVENLQLLCRLCNAGKGDGLGIDPRAEARHAGEAVAEIPRAHRAGMLYYVIERDGRRCSICSSQVAELTIRPTVATGAYARSNLRTVCYACAD